MAVNQVDASPAMIQGLWRDIRRDIGAPPKPEPEYRDPAQVAGSAAVVAITGKAIAWPLYMFAKKRLPHWQLTMAECTELGNAWGAVIDWMFPGEGLRGFMRWLENLLGRYGPLLDALKSTGRIVGDRVVNSERYALPAPEQQQERNDEGERNTVAQAKEKPAATAVESRTKNPQLAQLQE